MQLDLVESSLIPGELVEIVPPHSIHVSLTDLVAKAGVILVQEGIKVFEPKEVLLLNDLRIDVW